MASLTIGLISDTHGLLRPQAVNALQGCDYIVHAGDIGRGTILADLNDVAETFAIRGNIDRDEWAAGIPETRTVEIDGLRIYLIHDFKQLDLDPAREGIDVVVAGHSHKALVRKEKDWLYVNPGSAGPRRFKLPVTVGLLRVEEGGLSAKIVELEV